MPPIGVPEEQPAPAYPHPRIPSGVPGDPSGLAVSVCVCVSLVCICISCTTSSPACIIVRRLLALVPHSPPSPRSRCISWERWRVLPPPVLRLVLATRSWRLCRGSPSTSRIFPSFREHVRRRVVAVALVGEGSASRLGARVGAAAVRGVVVEPCALQSHEPGLGGRLWRGGGRGAWHRRGGGRHTARRSGSWHSGTGSCARHAALEPRSDRLASHGPYIVSGLDFTWLAVADPDTPVVCCVTAAGVRPL